MTIALTLPRDVKTVGTVRRLCARALAELGVATDIVGDVELAVTEACNNAVAHTGEHYEVQVTMDAERCRIVVVDSGPGFTGAPPRDPLDEGGRGLELMRALADRVHFELLEGQGTAVTLEKSLSPPR